MKGKILICIFIFAIVQIALAQKMNSNATLNSLVEAERGFASASVAKGTREAFIMNLADESTLFRPHAVAGKQWMTQQPARPGLLTWQPIYADVSASGELGYTTGPWEFRRNGPDDKEVAHGNFVSLWKKQADGTWKVVVDTGISNPPPATKPEGVQLAPAASAPLKIRKTNPASLQAALLNRDLEFSRASEHTGALSSYLAYTTDDVRVFREEKFPFIGKQAVRAALTEQAGLLKWQPAKADVARAGDLGYTYGIAEFTAQGASKTEYFNYVRIWKRQSEGNWKVVLDAFNPCPPPPSRR
ncbi:MAG: nuclear transport factor 2 family protein [Blastocatellia bacterium]